MGIQKSDRGRAEQPYQHFELTEAPGYLLRRCHQRSHELYNEATAGFGLTRQQFSLLYVLMRRPGSTIQELVDHTATDRNTLAGIVGRLEAKGLLARTRSARDARANELEITAAGIAILEEMEQAISTVGERILAPLLPEERQLFLKFAKMIAGIGPSA